MYFVHVCSSRAASVSDAREAPPVNRSGIVYVAETERSFANPPSCQYWSIIESAGAVVATSAR